jgi:hypothetical protein
VKSLLKTKSTATAADDLSSREAVARFREETDAFTANATRSRKSAREALISSGIYTKTGRLAKNYR